MLAVLFAAVSLLIWIYMILGRGWFWLARERDDRNLPPEPVVWPAVCAIVPARDEADVIARSIGSLIAQDYPGRFHVILIDDDSADGTAEVARQGARALGADERLKVVAGQSLPPGWTGKLWAMAQGVDQAQAFEPEFLLLTDADIAHTPDNLRRLVTRAEADGRVMVSLMARLRCDTFAETMLIPAFVYFFDMLYPFALVNNPRSKVAAAAGGCMLVRRHALNAGGGIPAIRTAIIDDCALARVMKPQGPIWLGLTDQAQSLRSYGGFAGLSGMVARSAYAQLNYSALILLGTVLGMALTYLAPPLVSVFASGWARWMGLAAWVLMALSFQPMLRFYRRSPLWGAALPLIGALYSLFTVQSAIDVWTGKGGYWKGRAQAQAQTAKSGASG